MSFLKKIVGFIINTFLFIFLMFAALSAAVSFALLTLMARVYLWFFKPKFIPADIHVEQKYYPYSQEEVIIFNT